MPRVRNHPLDFFRRGWIKFGDNDNQGLRAIARREAARSRSKTNKKLIKSTNQVVVYNPKVKIKL